MGEFFKRIGIGVLVIISSPLWLAYYLLHVLYGILLLAFAPLRLIIDMAAHRKITIKNEYDVKAKAILKSRGLTPSDEEGAAASPDAEQMPHEMRMQTPTATQPGYQQPNYTQQNYAPPYQQTQTYQPPYQQPAQGQYGGQWYGQQGPYQQPPAGYGGYQGQQQPYPPQNPGYQPPAGPAQPGSAQYSGNQTYVGGTQFTEGSGNGQSSGGQGK